MSYITISDVEILFRKLEEDEAEKAEALISVVESSLKQEAFKVHKNIDHMLLDGSLKIDVLKSVMVDVIGRALNTSTKAEPMSQMSESALGYSVSGTYLVPGGGLFIKKTELARLGLRRQRMGVIDLC